MDSPKSPLNEVVQVPKTSQPITDNMGIYPPIPIQCSSVVPEIPSLDRDSIEASEIEQLSTEENKKTKSRWNKFRRIVLFKCNQCEMVNFSTVRVFICVHHVFSFFKFRRLKTSFPFSVTSWSINLLNLLNRTSQSY